MLVCVVCRTCSGILLSGIFKKNVCINVCVFICVTVCTCVCVCDVCTEHEQALMRYMKLPKKKEEKAKVEANDDLHNMRRKFHQVS